MYFLLEDFVDYYYSESSIRRFQPYFDESKYKITLDGNPDTMVEITDYCYAESYRVRVFFYPGISVPGNYLTYADEVLYTAEILTGLRMMGFSYINENDVLCSGLLDLCYGGKCNIPVYRDDGKLNIYVVPDETSSPFSATNHIVINPIDLDINDVSNFTLAHEVIHSLQMTNGFYLGSLITEGAATALSYYLCGDVDMIATPPRAIDYNYSFYETPITVDNVESLLRSEKEDTWEDYMLGYRFCSYLVTLNGTYFLNDILIEMDKEYDKNYHSFTNSEAIDLIINMTGNKNICKDFAEWVNQPENASRFKAEDFDYSTYGK